MQSVRMLIVFAGVIAMCGTAVVAGVQPGEPANERARALVAVLSIHDASIRTLEYNVEYSVPKPGFPPTVFRSHQVFDDNLRWACDMMVTWADPPAGTAPVTEWHFRVDGQQKVAWAENDSRIGISASTTDRLSYSGPDAWLGRWLDGAGVRRLGETLAAAHDLTIFDADADQPVLTATAEFSSLIARVDVTIDVKRGGPPERITLRDRALNVAYYDYRVLEWTQVSGVWLPAVATLDTRKLAPMGEREAAFVEATAREGVGRGSDMFDAGVQAKFRRVIREVFGTDEAPSVPMMPTHRATFTYVAVNAPIPAERFTRMIALEDKAYNGLTDCVKSAGESEWVSQAPSAENP